MRGDANRHRLDLERLDYRSRRWRLEIFFAQVIELAVGRVSLRNT